MQGELSAAPGWCSQWDWSSGKAWWVKPWIHWHGTLPRYYSVNQTLDAWYFRCISLIRAVAGMGRAGLCSCSCRHSSRMGAWLCIPSHQRKLSLQHTSQLVQIYFGFAVCCQRCNHLLIEKCFIATYFCCCFPPNVQHTMETQCVRRGKSQEKMFKDRCFCTCWPLIPSFFLMDCSIGIGSSK